MKSSKKTLNWSVSASTSAHSYPHIIHLCGKRSAIVRVHKVRINLGITWEQICVWKADRMRIERKPKEGTYSIPSSSHNSSPIHTHTPKRNPQHLPVHPQLSTPSTGLRLSPLYFIKKSVTCSHHPCLLSCEILLYQRQPSSRTLHSKPYKWKEC